MPSAAATHLPSEADADPALTELLGRLLQMADPVLAEQVKVAPLAGAARLARLEHDGVLVRRRAEAVAELASPPGPSLCLLAAGRPLLLVPAGDGVWTADLGNGRPPQPIRDAALRGIVPCERWTLVAAGDSPGGDGGVRCADMAGAPSGAHRDLDAAGPWRGGLTAYLRLVAQTLGLATPIAMMLIIDKVVSQGARNTLIVLLAGVALLTVFQYLFLACHALQVCRDMEVGALPRRRRVLEALLASPSAARWRSVGWEVIHGCSEASRFAVETRPQLLADVLYVGLLTWLMAAFSPLLLAVTLAFVPVFVLVEAWTSRRAEGDAAGCTALRNRLSTRYSEAVAAAELLRGLDLCGHTLAGWRRLDEQLARARLRLALLRRLSSHAIEFLQRLSLLLVMLLGVSSVLAGAMTLGQYIAFNLLSMQLAQPVLRMAAYRRARQDHGLSRHAERELQGECRRDAWPDGGEVHLPAAPLTVDVEDLQLAGDAGAVNLLLRPGLWLGVSGPSGCGKSTLLRSLAGLHEPSRGRVLVGDVPVGQLATSERARLVRLVPQEAVVFSASLGENIRLGDLAATPRQILEAALVCGLAPLLDGLPEHLNTLVGDAGRRLSGGERQRLALARAILCRPRVLLLDEATAGLDEAAEATLLLSLQRYLPEAAVVMVSHRPSSLSLCHERLNLGPEAPPASRRPAVAST